MIIVYLFYSFLYLYLIFFGIYIHLNLHTLRHIHYVVFQYTMQLSKYNLVQ